MSMFFIVTVLCTKLPFPEPLKDVPEIKNRIEIRRGSQGVVEKVCFKEQLFAMKSTYSNVEAMQNIVKNEITILHSLDHPNIIKFSSFWENELTQMHNDQKFKMHCYHYLLELMDGDLYDHLENLRFKGNSLHKYMQQKHELQIIYNQILSALKYIHGLGIYHLDIKTENILVKTENGQTVYKLGDFGLSTTTPSARLVGTPDFFPPEMYNTYIERSLLIDIRKAIMLLTGSHQTSNKMFFTVLNVKFQTFQPPKQELLTYIFKKFKELLWSEFIRFLIDFENSTRSISNRIVEIGKMTWDAQSTDIFEFGKTLLDVGIHFDNARVARKGTCFDGSQQISQDEMTNEKFDISPSFAKNLKFQSIVRKMMHCEFEKRPTAAVLMNFEF